MHAVCVWPIGLCITPDTDRKRFSDLFYYILFQVCPYLRTERVG